MKKIFKKLISSFWLLCIFEALVFGQATDTTAVDYFNYSQKFLVFRDLFDQERAYYVPSPIRLKYIMWDDASSLLYLTIGAQGPSSTISKTIQYLLKLKSLSPLNIKHISIHWDDKLLSTSTSYVLVTSPYQGLEEINIVFEFTPERYLKVKNVFENREKEHVPFTGSVEITYFGVESHLSLLRLNRLKVYQELQSRSETWTKSRIEEILKSIVESWIVDSEKESSLNRFWIDQMVEFYFKERQDDSALYDLKAISSLPDGEEVFTVNEATQKDRKTKLFFSLF